jgi:glycolate oxidase FAD binding subunit
MDGIVAAWKERILAAGPERPLRLRGGGSKDFYGGEPVGELLDTRACSGIVDYEPTELVITARAGTPLADIEATLAGQGQMLACEPPRFGAATLGGAVASGLSGPRRAAAGSLRDFVLGVQLLDGEGRLLKFGGQVMKNVAGYDVSRLLCGSLGTPGILVEVSLKVLPRPAMEASIRFELDQQEALRRMNRWSGQPLPISASCWHAGALTLRLSGARAAVAAAQAALGGEALADTTAADFWASLREQTHDFFADGARPLWRMSLPSTAPQLDLPGAPLIEWGGAQRWLRGGKAEDCRRMAQAVGGHATLFRGGDKRDGVFQPLAPAMAALHGRLKAAFDPRRVFNPGRLHPDL